MTVFLIILAVLAVLFGVILSLSAEFTVIFDNGWTTKIRVLFIEKDIKLSQLLSFLVAPDKAGQQAAEKAKDKKKKQPKDVPSATQEEESQLEITVQPEENAQTEEAQPISEPTEIVEEPAPAPQEKKPAPAKKNPIQKILDEDGVVGILLLVSNLIQTVNTAVTTLIKGLHIYSLYVKMIIGGGGAADIAEKYGAMCGWYYPLKGYILNQMRVDNYDDLITADFIAPRSEYEFQFIGSISIGLLLKMGLKAGAVFLVNFIKNK